MRTTSARRKSSVFPRAGDVGERGRARRRRAGSRSALSSPRQRQVLAGQPALARVVVDDVEEHLEAGLVQRVDRAARPRRARRPGPAAWAAAVAYGGVRGEEAERVVAPVVGQALLDAGAARRRTRGSGSSSTVVTPRPSRWSIDRGVREAGVGAAQLRRAAGRPAAGQAADVRLVDDRVRPRRPRAVGGRVRSGQVAGVDDDRVRDVAGASRAGRPGRTGRRRRSSPTTWP